MGKLDWAKAEEIRQLVKAGMDRVAIAMHFGVSVETVNKVHTGRVWLYEPGKPRVSPAELSEQRLKALLAEGYFTEKDTEE